MPSVNVGNLKSNFSGGRLLLFKYIKNKNIFKRVNKRKNCRFLQTIRPLSIWGIFNLSFTNSFLNQLKSTISYEKI
jgi:hypothetical protein